MRFAVALVSVLALAGSPVAASWWSSNKPEYDKWDTNELKHWLQQHSIHAPKSLDQNDLRELVASNWELVNSWSQDQYKRAQQVFSNAKDYSFDTWDENTLRSFLIDLGVASPSGRREELVHTAKQHYTSYTSAMSSAASKATSSVSEKETQASNFYNYVTDTASSIYDSVSDTASTVAAQATGPLVRALNDTTDYVYSTWDDSRLRDYLESKGIIEPKQKTTREQLLAHMHDAYAAVANPIWNAWSDAYIHEWLVNHNVIKSDDEKRRDALVAKMKLYYYTPQQRVWDAWSESDLKQWLVNHKIIKSDAQVSREKMRKLVADNYANAKDTFWSSWSDSELHRWLIDHGYLRSDAQVARDRLISLINEKYIEANAQVSEFLTWPDARLRAFLRNHGTSESALPTSRPGLLQEVRIRYVQASSRLEQLYTKLKTLVASGVSSAEDVIGQALDALGGVERKTEAKKKSVLGDAYDYLSEKAGYGDKRARDTKESMEKKTEL